MNSRISLSFIHGYIWFTEIHFIQSEELIEHDDYFDLYKQELHKIMQDEMAVANKVEPVVKNKMVRKPKKFSYTSVDRI